MNTKNQHFVPRAYLKFFSRKIKDSFYVAVGDKNKEEAFLCNIENIASYRNFYETNSKPNNYWENYYNNIESMLPRLFNNIIAASTISSNNTTILNDYLKKDICKIICSQVTRTRKAREFFDNLGSKISNDVINVIEKDLSLFLSNEQKEVLNKYKNNHNFILSTELETINSDRIMNIGTYHLMNRVWVIYKNLNYNTNPFMTSDHPVVYYNIRTKKYDLESNGIGLNTTVIEFPINKELLLVLYPRNMWFGCLKKLNNKVIYLKDDSYVFKVNQLQYQQCYRQIYYTID